MAQGAADVSPEDLLGIWVAQSESEPQLTKEKALEYLASIYDAESGAYTRLGRPLQTETVPAEGEPSSLPEPLSERVAIGEITATYAAAEFLELLGEDLPDVEKTLEFVMRCKCAFGFENGA